MRVEAGVLYLASSKNLETTSSTRSVLVIAGLRADNCFTD